jgi:hypothetical protein
LYIPALNSRIEIVAGFDRQSLPQFGILIFEVLQMGNAARWVTSIRSVP